MLLNSSNPFGQRKHGWGPAREGGSQKGSDCEDIHVTQGRKRFYSSYEMWTKWTPSKRCFGIFLKIYFMYQIIYQTTYLFVFND